MFTENETESPIFGQIYHKFILDNKLHKELRVGVPLLRLHNGRFW